MPKLPSTKLNIHLDLLKPQSSSEKILSKLIRWLLSTGRYIFIFVEALVLLAFFLRFSLDEKLQSNNETIKKQLPYIQSLKSVEIAVREIQLKLSTIDSFYTSYADYSLVLIKIAGQTPLGVKLINLNLQKNVAKITINFTAQAQNNADLASFLAGLKQDPFFSDVHITSIGFEKGSLNFSLSAVANISAVGGKNL